MPIVIATWKTFVRVDVRFPSYDNFNSSAGLMGSFVGGKKVGRDKVTLFDNIDEFGKEWQVLETEPMLFHNVDGPQKPQQLCVTPSNDQ